MIAKHRNWALVQIVVAIALTVALVMVFRKSVHVREGADNWDVLGIALYVAAYAAWVSASLTLARARGYQRDAMGALFMVVFVIGFCIPILPILFPFFIIFGLQDRTKDRMRRR
jgi:cytochrome c oxidase assembly factor CtaG